MKTCSKLTHLTNSMRILIVLLVLPWIAQSCQVSQAPLSVEAQPPALLSTTDSLPPATTVATGTLAPTSTLVPTSTPVPTNTRVATNTPTPKPTMDKTATEAIKATAAMNVLQDQIQTKFAELKLKDTQGSLAWVQSEEIFLMEDQHARLNYVPLDKNTNFSNFILHTDVGWSSTGGLAGCGLIFRSDNNIQKGSQYRFYTMRLSGLPLWDVERWQYGHWQATMTGQSRSSQAIEEDQGAINEYVLVARGSTLTVYANGIRLGTMSDNKLTDGQITYFVFQDSGETTCTFTDTWIWTLE